MNNDKPVFKIDCIKLSKCFNVMIFKNQTITKTYYQCEDKSSNMY